MVNERVVNLPAFIAVNMHKVLVNDIKSQCSKEERKKSYVVGISVIEKIKQGQKNPGFE